MKIRSLFPLMAALSLLGTIKCVVLVNQPSGNWPAAIGAGLLAVLTIRFTIAAAKTEKVDTITIYRIDGREPTSIPLTDAERDLIVEALKDAK